jgi:hypothetical protein
MQIDLGELAKHFASMTDEELFEQKREELTETAQKVYDREIAHRVRNRAFAPRTKDNKVEASFSEYNSPDEDEDPDPDWHQDGTVACSFVCIPGNNAMEMALKAQVTLQAAEIPSHLRRRRDLDPGGEPEPSETLEVLVPVGLAVHAASILDRDLFNDEFETHWRDHLSMLSNKDLMALDPDIFCAGLMDKLARMKRIYADEMAKRKMKDQSI